MIADLINRLQHFTATGQFDGGQIIGSIAQNIVENLEDDLADAGDAIADVFDDLRDGWNKFWDGIFRTSGSTGKTAADVQAAATQIANNTDAAQSTADTAQDSTIYLQTLLTLPRYTPRWLSSGPQDEVAFPVALINTTVTPTLGVLQLIPVTSETSRPVKSVKFGLAGATSMTNLYVGIYRYDGTNLVLDVDLGDIKSSMVGTKLQAYNMPAELSVTRGETVYIGVLQVGGTAVAMHATNIPSAGIIEPAQEIPNWIGSKYGSGLSALPSSFAAGSITEQSGPLWGALGSEVGAPTIPPLAFYSDNFNRANGDLGSSWIPMVSGLNILGNAVRGTETSRSRFYLPYNYPNQQAKVTVPTSNVSVSIGKLAIRGSGSGNYAFAEFRPNGFPYKHKFAIGTSAGGIETLRNSSTVNWQFAAGDSFEISAVGNVYTCAVNGATVVSWTDSGGIFTYPSSGTFAAIAGCESVAFDNFEMRDIG
ncbi:hypothetical protein BN970_01382 [Mycolicibacterium conceptionense]|uniref:Bacteriophage protein n=1 Tax=Mycolicibacterium conceptionense TaxID=451644 RepID=A0A0U1D3F5_9MYCO|nr:hypothetical protein BN970_01382 [Mycolicibacterium conceptionense]